MCLALFYTVPLFFLIIYKKEDGKKQLEKYNKKSNNIPKICLGFLTPNEMMKKYLYVM